MTQQIDGENHQIIHRGTIINCHGATICPIRNVPESMLQSDFAQTTGIWCPAGAREVLEVLMRDHGFTAKGLAAAWRADSLDWDNDKAMLIVRTPLVEAVFGWIMLLLMFGYFVLAAAPLLLSEQRDLHGLTTFLLASVIYLGCAWLIARFVFKPRNVALRVNSALAGWQAGSLEAS